MVATSVFTSTSKLFPVESVANLLTDVKRLDLTLCKMHRSSLSVKIFGYFFLDNLLFFYFVNNIVDLLPSVILIIFL